MLKKDTVYEESAVPVHQYREEKIYKILRVAGIVCLVVAVLVLFPGLSRGYGYLFGEDKDTDLLYSFLSALIFFVVLAIPGVIFLVIKNRFNVVYDYTFVSGELRITKVIGAKRKPLFKITPNEVSKVGKVGSREYDSIRFNRSIPLVRFTHNKQPMEGKSFYYLLYGDNLGKKMMILECREELIAYMRLYLPKDTVESD